MERKNREEQSLRFETKIEKINKQGSDIPKVFTCEHKIIKKK